ncbi:MAG TPA: TM0106 family RecB-like putative nuclease [Pyrinomonadaceae bacterium]|nr:TM0106 family RecB-like putative nuclease [Pyrinomonadaceae bacterium]
MSQNLHTVTPSHLYDYLQCPHKVWRDVHGPLEDFVEEENPFLKLLWERGVQHEADVVAKLGFAFLDCSQGSEAERIEATNQALARGEPYIYQGVLAHGDLFGIPDLLHYDGSEYIPIEIKSGSAEDGGNEDSAGKLKKHYAVQLALYCEILQRRGLHASFKAFVIDSSGERFEYDLRKSQGPKSPETYLDLYSRVRHEVVALMSGESQNDPAMCGACKQCGWTASCKKWAKDTDDLTQVFYVGRTVRDTIRRDIGASSISELLRQDPAALVERKKTEKGFLKGLGASTLEKIAVRGRLLKEGGEPIIHSAFAFPEVRAELFFDIESDPTQDFIYLHGFWVRDGAGERFDHTVATAVTPDEEKKAWRKAIEFILSFDHNDSAVYYYSSYEKTSYRRLRQKYPEVISEEDLELIFSRPTCIDLYEIVFKNTDWPLGSYGIKAIAQYLGFDWRDKTPSGALSIQWFNEFIKTGDQALLDRILKYNEDDCKATVIVKDYLQQRMETI